MAGGPARHVRAGPPPREPARLDARHPRRRPAREAPALRRRPARPGHRDQGREADDRDAPHPRSGSDTYLWDSMGSITGTSCAAFTALALGRQERSTREAPHGPEGASAVRGSRSIWGRPKTSRPAFSSTCCWPTGRRAVTLRTCRLPGPCEQAGARCRRTRPRGRPPRLRLGAGRRPEPWEAETTAHNLSLSRHLSDMSEIGDGSVGLP